jgi:hypothetical protein
MMGDVFLFGNNVQAIPLPFVYKTKNLSLEEQGLNEYIDPSKSPKYTQNYNEIYFGSEGISVDELAELSQVVDLTENPTETPQAVMSVGDEDSVSVEVSKDKIKLKKDFEAKKSELKKGNKTLKNEKSFETSKVMSVSFNADPSDEKVAELNFYRGKDENREALEKGLVELKEKVKTEQDVNTKKKLEESVSKGTEMLAQRQAIVDKNQSTWEMEKTEKSVIINKYSSKVQYAYSAPNKELMDILYPNKEAVDKLNADILAEREQIKKYKLDEIWKKEEMKKELMGWFMPEEAYAGYLNNFVATLIMYPRSNINLRIDLMGNSIWAGNEFHLWTANGGDAQKFKFLDETGEIKHAQSGWCMDRSGNYNGAKVQLWPCNGSWPQQWQAFPDGTIRPQNHYGYCLDASSGVNNGSKLHLWGCYDTDRQKFQIGEEDFGKFDHFIRLHSSRTASVEIYPLNVIGHSLVSLVKQERGTWNWHLTNIFSFWGGNDYSRDWFSANIGGRTNNIRNWSNSENTWSNLVVDGGSPNHEVDWVVGYGEGHID